ncbi:MAG: Translation initiation factor IF-2B subunit alpha, partial [Thermococcales archaeon 44_46]
MLPEEIEELLKGMNEEKVHGASYLAKMGAKAYMLLAERFEGEELVEKLKELGVEIINVNPTMASLYNLVRFIPITPDPEFVKAKAEEFIRLSEEAKREIGNIGSELIDHNEVIITHSYSSTVFEILKKAKEKGKIFKVVLTESEPDYEGLFLAKKLEELEIPFEVITDAQLGLFAKKATLALVGADNITKDGYVFNKAGTYLLALA